MQGLSMTYELVGIGWARLELATGHDRLVFDDLSYLDEPLHDLLIAGLHVSLGRLPRSIEFNNEGEGISRMGFERRDDWSVPSDRQVIAITHSHQSMEELADWSPPSEILTDKEGFARAALACADAVLARYGLEDYDSRWYGQGFPVRAMEALRSALAVRDPVGLKYAEP